jgi:exopolysaccharide/PEP-CTERM locus tyrosine autokinase
MSIVERVLAKANAARGRSQSGTQTPRQQRPIGPNGAPPDALESEVQRQVDINLDALRGMKMLAPPHLDYRMAEELRVIKRPLLLNAEQSAAPIVNGNLVMIASALPGAGKTFLSLNLALSMASELDWNVLLVDGDVSRATLSRSLGLGDAPGLVGLLEDDRGSIASYVHKTNFPGLQVLPAGQSRPQVKELLSSQRLRALVAELAAGERRIVLFDSPPLLLTSEARVLAAYVGQIVVVVEAGVTPRRSLLEAVELLDPSKAINLVMNKSQQLFGIGDYYSGYEQYGPGPDPQRQTEA